MLGFRERQFLVRGNDLERRAGGRGGGEGGQGGGQ